VVRRPAGTVRAAPPASRPERRPAARRAVIGARLRGGNRPHGGAVATTDLPDARPTAGTTADPATVIRPRVGTSHGAPPRPRTPPSHRAPPPAADLPAGGYGGRHPGVVCERALLAPPGAWLAVSGAWGLPEPRGPRAWGLPEPRGPRAWGMGPPRAPRAQGTGSPPGPGEARTAEGGERGVLRRRPTTPPWPPPGQPQGAGVPPGRSPGRGHYPGKPQGARAPPGRTPGGAGTTRAKPRAGVPPGRSPGRGYHPGEAQGAGGTPRPPAGFAGQPLRGAPRRPYGSDCPRGPGQSATP
jgi:translation initiation factor IF-2